MSYKKAKEKYKKAKKELEQMIAEEGQHIVHEMLDEFVKSYKGIDCVRWKQYTPYFDDGNPCVFSIHQVSVKLTEEAYFEVTGRSIARVEEDEVFLNSWNISKYDRSTDSFTVTPSGQVLINAIEKLEKQLYEEEMLLEKTFGDHTQVTYYKGDFFLEECQHD